MFTGIIEEKGAVIRTLAGDFSGSIQIKACKVLEGSKTGDSIAVNGVCLTVTEIFNDSFTADVSPQTLTLTNLGTLSRGNPVNLERALSLQDRLGGHIVTGHVDSQGKILSIENKGNSVFMKIQCSPKSLDFIVEQGSIAVDGISLTIAKVNRDIISLVLIPKTLEETNLSSKKCGDAVNIETDILAKYIKKAAESKSKISLSFLRENGF